MSRVICAIAVLLMMVPASSYTKGTLHLFADTTSLDISADIAEHGTQNIWIAYSPSEDELFQCATGLAFSVNWDAAHLVQAGNPVFHEIVHSFLGQIRTGISIVLARELWISEGCFFLGYFPVLGLEAIVRGSEPVVLSVEGDPNTNWDPPIITDCLTQHNIRAIHRSKFVFPYEARVIAVESKTWGAVKALFK
jgi:hypothetical protein